MEEDTSKAVDLRSKVMEDQARGSIENIDGNLGPIIGVAGRAIARQRARLGGEWATAFVVFSRRQRRSIREMFGSDLVFIALNLSKECLENRLKVRHGDGAFSELVTKFLELFEPVGDDEENTYNICVTEDMNPDDVVNKTLEILKQL